MAGLVVVPDLLFRIFNDGLYKYSFGNIIQALLVAGLMVLIPYKKLRWTLFFIILFFCGMELCHFAFFGVIATPYTYVWMMSELWDTIDGALHSLNLIYAPICVLLPAGLLLFLDVKFDGKIKRSKVALYILTFVFIFMVVDVNRQNRAFFYMGTNKKAPVFVNAVKKLNFILFKAVPKVLFSGYNTHFSEYKIENVAGPKRVNIIYIFGESANPNFMSLYGYNRPTTPFLDGLKNDKTFYYSKGYSSSVSTVYSVMMNFYMQREPENYAVQQNKKSDILALAKQAGFKSWFIEANTTHPDYEGKVDNFINIVPAVLANNYSQGEVNVVLSKLPRPTELGDKNIIWYHQNIIHFDYAKHYNFDKKFDVFKPDDDSTKSRKVAEYSNSVLVWDDLNKNIFKYAREVAEKTGAPTYIIYQSDHGELVGQNKRGHSFLSREVATIPVFAKCYNCRENIFMGMKNPTHYRMNKKLLNLFGFELINENDDGKTFYINGKSLYGDDGFITMTD